MNSMHFLDGVWVWQVNEGFITKQVHPLLLSMKQQAPPMRLLARTRLILKSYPLHRKDELMTYNLYREDPVEGVTQSIPLRFPLVREGCMTSCYFEGDRADAETLKEPCGNCGNQSFERVFLDVGFKAFLAQHYKYIRLNEPLSVEMNPFRKEFLFSCSGLKNSLLGQLSAYIGGKIFEDMGFALTPALTSQLLDFGRVNQELQGLMAPVLKKRKYLCYNFCKYVPTAKDAQQLHILLFLFGEALPAKARIILDSTNGEMCPLRTFLDQTMVGFLGELNTLVFVVPLPGATEYYVSKVDQHFSREEGVLRVVHMREWRDPQGRFNGSLVVDQKSGSVFAIGGYDHTKNDSLEFISCFIKCRWEREGSQRLQLKADIQKGHRMFQGRIGAYNTGMFNTVFKNPYNENKIAFRNATFMLYSFDREYGEQLDSDIATGVEKMRKNFFNVGGGLKDSTIFATGRFSTKKPGIRYLTYDTTSNENPIINESAKGEINFPGNNYIVIELPFFSTQTKKKFKHHCIVIGGHRDPQQRSDKKEGVDFRDIHFVDTNNLELSVPLAEKFHLSAQLPPMVDQFTAILKVPKTKDGHYLRATYPLVKPIQVGNAYVHYIVLEFGLTTGLFEIIPGVIEKVQ